MGHLALKCQAVLQSTLLLLKARQRGTRQRGGDSAATSQSRNGCRVARDETTALYEKGLVKGYEAGWLDGARAGFAAARNGLRLMKGAGQDLWGDDKGDGMGMDMGKKAGIGAL